jgi:tripartite-type tricarboxylate transporter receptor subunit TctC
MDRDTFSVLPRQSTRIMTRILAALFIGSISLADARAAQDPLPAAHATSTGSGHAYPTRPIRWIVPFPPGGGTDSFARLLAPKVSEAWKQQVVIDNRGGAGGIVGTETAARANPDGYTYLVSTAAGIVTNPLLIPSLPYGTKDFAPVSLLVVTPLLLVVNSTVPIHTVKELIAAARTKPGVLNYSSSGSGSANHLAMELLKSLTGTDILHVPYKGSGPAVTDLVGGRVQMMFNPLPPFLPHIKAGRLRPIAVAEPQRSSLMPDIPTFQESGVSGYQYVLWYGMFTQARTPRAIIAKMNAEVAKVLAEPDTAARLAAQGAVPRPTAPEAFARFIDEDRVRLQKVIRVANVKAE